MPTCPQWVPVVHRIRPFVHTNGVKTGFIGRIAKLCAAREATEIVIWPPGSLVKMEGSRGCSLSMDHCQRFVI
jgi:hypothetical protein